MLIWLGEIPPKKVNPILFLDRDGVLNVDSPDYIKKPEELVIYDDAFEFLKPLSSYFTIVIISNQSGIGRRYITIENFWNIHFKMIKAFEKEGIFFSGAFYCPHTPSQKCKCRKPSPEMVFTAGRIFSWEPSKSLLVGDKLSDVETAKRAGIEAILVKRDGILPSIEGLKVFSNLRELLEHLSV